MAGGADGGHLRPASFELLRATGVAHHNGMYFCTALAAAAIPLGEWLGQEGMVLQASALLLMVAIFWIAIRLYDREKAVRFEDVLVCLFGGLMIPGPVHAGGAEGDGAGALPGAPAGNLCLSY